MTPTVQHNIEGRSSDLGIGIWDPLIIFQGPKVAKRLLDPSHTSTFLFFLTPSPFSYTKNIVWYWVLCWKYAPREWKVKVVVKSGQGVLFGVCCHLMTLVIQASNSMHHPYFWYWVLGYGKRVLQYIVCGLLLLYGFLLICDVFLDGQNLDEFYLMGVLECGDLLWVLFLSSMERRYLTIWYQSEGLVVVRILVKCG